MKNPKTSSKKLLVITQHYNQYLKKKNKDINTPAKHFMKRLNGMLHVCFKKIRIPDKSNTEIYTLFKPLKIL